MNATIVDSTEPDVEIDEPDSLVRFPSPDEKWIPKTGTETTQSEEVSADIIDFCAEQEVANAEAKAADDRFEIDWEIHSAVEPRKNAIVLSDPLEDALFFCWATAIGVALGLALVS
jgi:hypothetical protein